MNIFSRKFTKLQEAWIYRHEPEHYGRLAEYFWNAVLLFVLVLVACIAIYAGLRFISIASRGGPQLTADAVSAPLNREQLQETLDGFKRRSDRYESLKRAPPQVADPSR